MWPRTLPRDLVSFHVTWPGTGSLLLQNELQVGQKFGFWVTKNHFVKIPHCTSMYSTSSYLLNSVGVDDMNKFYSSNYFTTETRLSSTVLGHKSQSFCDLSLSTKIGRSSMANRNDTRGTNVIISISLHTQKGDLRVCIILPMILFTESLVGHVLSKFWL